ncbi:MAG: AbrB/MazE/SpoVT family DNA-binding domain-containing protein [Clostridiales bacterium]|jgi:transcriptional pleiotropic regulator of transition state genes|nr:AbrB/MazE/SpoVT family DNA-binding domain-containing protein [Clostridiales bacterium]
MEALGIIRRVDNLGRIVPPKELRQALGLNEGKEVEFISTGCELIIRKPGCIFTGEQENLIEYCGKKVSKRAAQEIAVLAGIKIRRKDKR